MTVLFRFPFAPLEARVCAMLGVRPHVVGGCPCEGVHGYRAACGSSRSIGDACGVAGRTVTRWRTRGLTFEQADNATTRLGLYLGEVWPDECDQLDDLQQRIRFYGAPTRSVFQAVAAGCVSFTDVAAAVGSTRQAVRKSAERLARDGLVEWKPGVPGTLRLTADALEEMAA